jgi:hypothetical protein
VLSLPFHPLGWNSTQGLMIDEPARWVMNSVEERLQHELQTFTAIFAERQQYLLTFFPQKRSVILHSDLTATPDHFSLGLTFALLQPRTSQFRHRLLVHSIELHEGDFILVPKYLAPQEEYPLI